ncbi:MAG: Acyl-CoA carboxylase epsilon subunit [Frankiales bacterium]|jgi:hypothetical protein|nr:Acyl-CoA carboxylase epsilon subunit [Frankiales bacterium]
MPILRVVRGDASPEELAAVVALLAARSRAEVLDVVVEPSLWSRPLLRGSRVVGPGAWRASALPR